MKKAAEIRNFVIAGHAGSGKTTLSELLIFKGKSISRQGSVESKNTASDFTAEEQERGGSIYAAALNTVWKDHQLFFSDTPGYGEFIGEVTAAYGAADAALVVIDAVDGPQVGTARAWKFARLAGKPRAAFVNRLDRDRADFAAVQNQVYAFAEKAGGQNYWLAKAFIVLGDTFAEQENMAQARATFESIKSGYTPTGAQDDVLDQVELRLKKLN